MSGLEELSREELVNLTRRLIARVEELTQVNAELTERVARLERLVLRNSKNSGMPPSKDDDAGRSPPVEQPAAPGRAQARRRGKQRGAPGMQLAWSAAPDDTVAHHPAGVCECGLDLAAARGLGVCTPPISRSTSR